MTITNEMQEAIDLIQNTNQNLYITGKAGTGKTTFLHYLMSHVTKRMIVAASTGIAAINAGGVTLHSLFNIPFGVIVEGQNLSSSFHPEKAQILNQIDVLIIDEISMVRADVLDFVDWKLRQYRLSDDPFGGVQIVMFGDLYQLPPVCKRNESNILLHYYSSPYFFDSKVFTTEGGANFKVIELSHVFRQSDQRFIEILNNIREYNITQEDIDDLGSLRDRADSENFGTTSIHICAYRKDVQAINKRLLGTPTHTYNAQISGDFPESSAPCEHKLELRVGARVMMLVNDPTKLYCNGSLGWVTALTDSSVTVRLDNGYSVAVGASEWKNNEYKMKDGKIQTVEKGSCKQIPIALAWAITIHKSQGLTFDHIVIHTKGVFAPGQVYVALSRCTSMEGISSDTFIDRRHILTDRRLQVFHHACKLTNGIYDRNTHKMMKTL